ncbi:MAG: DUF4232 domain-containing protein [Acidimicrobiaceae bacterium]|nr:DUF4232 domain-containing protein [Acidimicrobiaceae bacterium]
MRVSTGTVIGAALAAAMALGACGGGNKTASGPPATGASASAKSAPSTTARAITTIPTLPPTTAAPPTTKASPTTKAPTTTAATTTTTPPPTTAAPTTAAPTTAAPTTAAPTTAATTAPATAAIQPCRTVQLTASLSGASGAAGTIYYNLNFHNGSSTPCTLFGYPGVSYVRGSTGIQTGDPASRNASISGASSPKAVTLAAGGSAHAVVGEVEVANYPSATCRPVAVRGLRVYPPDQTAALFVPQVAKGCAATGVHQLSVGFVVT